MKQKAPSRAMGVARVSSKTIQRYLNAQEKEKLDNIKRRQHGKKTVLSVFTITI